MKIELDINDIKRRATATIGNLSWELMVMTARAEQAEAKAEALEAMLSKDAAAQPEKGQ